MPKKSELVIEFDGELVQNENGTMIVSDRYVMLGSQLDKKTCLPIEFDGELVQRENGNIIVGEGGWVMLSENEQRRTQ